MAAELPVYQLKLKRVDQPDASRVYRLTVENSQGQSVTPTAKMSESLKKIGQKFALTPQYVDASALKRTVEARPNLEYNLQFSWKITKGQGFTSCFQEWYKELDNTQRFLLLANLQDTEAADAAAQLATDSAALSKYISEKFGACAAKNARLVFHNTCKRKSFAALTYD